MGEVLIDFRRSQGITGTFKCVLKVSENFRGLRCVLGDFTRAFRVVLKYFSELDGVIVSAVFMAVSDAFRRVLGV